MKKMKSLRRSQLDQFFESLKALNLKLPKKGWVKEIRETLGMSMQDLAHRQGTIKQRVERIEKDEVSKKLTLESMQKVANALDCEFVYFLVPRSSLQTTLNEQAQKAAAEIVKNVNQTMNLEAQGTSEKSKRALVNKLAQEMLLKGDRKIWRSR